MPFPVSLHLWELISLTALYRDFFFALCLLSLKEESTTSLSDFFFSDYL